MRRLTFTCLAFVLWLSGGFRHLGQQTWLGTSVAAKEVWIQGKSSHFSFIANASEEDIRKVAAKLEQFRAVISHLFDKPRRNFTPPMTVVVFKDEASYAPYKPLYQGQPSDLSGYFQSSDDAIYITLSTNWRGSNPYAVIFHEYVHYLISDENRQLPTWLAEGMADYYSTAEMAAGGGRITIGRPIPERVRLLRQGQLIPLHTLLSVNHDSPFYNEADKKSLFYAESWALVHYLMAGGDTHRREQFQRFLSLLAERRTGEEAFRQAFQNDSAGLESELAQYVRRNNYVSRQVSVDGRLDVDEALRVLPLDEAESLAYLGDLLWHVSRYEDADVTLQRALVLNPQSLAANTSLGLLRIRQKRYAEALGHLRRAVDTGSGNYLSHYCLAYALQQTYVDGTGYISYFTPDAVAEMRASLNRARELAPAFADTYRSLAFINLVQSENLDEAETLMKRALELAPQREDFIYTLAQVFARQQNFAAARQTAQRLLRAETMPDIRNRAQFLLESITSREEAMARERAEEESRQRQRALQSGADDATRPPGKRFEGEQVRGLLTRIECPDSDIVLTVVSGGRAFKFRAQQGKLNFVRHTMDVPAQLTCGAIIPARRVIVTYRAPSRDRLKIDGEPVGVEFLKQGSD